MCGAAEARADPADAALPTPALFGRQGLRLIQVQATLNCNLHCHHCYSDSGPRRAAALPLDALQRFLPQARALGYGYVGVSGGEPLLWPDCERFLQSCRELGYSTALVTNGTLLDAPRARALAPVAGVVAVSVDGPPAEHDTMRGSPGAFRRMRRGLDALREQGQRFVLVFTLTRSNADRLAWLYAFADEVGAAALEVHPLCAFGAAAREMHDEVPDDREFRAAALLLALLSVERGPGGPAVFLDVHRRQAICACAWPLLAGGDAAGAGFADLVPALVVEPDGTLSPFIYGFPRRFAVGTVFDTDLATAAARWRDRHAARVAALLSATLARLEAAGEDYVDLFGQLLADAAAAPA
ncbi:radical SAM protein [Rubrivivax gelatinosus]|uniref:Radical SAM domain-containing protein n=1 Tax=Rubrivivax gelatinosus (strain NBRC 100245 / IL144) TaxID=983917 RepID=I0HXZ8_RUBGI|nr:radical SAM protein [Rubrivivax gelatinosus]BAL97885.1 radical SAM domain-containing protein [Rubrivivax gelatinosus IL144]